MLVPLRTSASAWLFVPLAVVYIVWTVNGLGGWSTAPSWNNFLAKSGLGLTIILPLVAGIAAWEAHRFRALSGSSSRSTSRPALLVIWSQVWQPAAVVGICYLLAFVGFGSRNGWPQAGVGDARIPLAFLFMTFGAIGFGYLLGSFIDAVVAVPVSIFVMFTWATYPSMDGENLSWRNISGFSLWDSAPTFGLVPDAGALVAPVVVGLAIVLVAVVVSLRRRRLGLSLVGVVVIAAAILFANTAVEGTRPYPYAERAQSELVCTTERLDICLWPEQDALIGASVRSDLTTAVASAERAGLPLPTRIASVSPDFVGSLDADQTPLYIVDNSGSTESLLRAYVEGIVSGRVCSQFEFTESNEWALWRARYAVALVVGLDPELTLPYGPGGATPEQLEELGIANSDEAIAAYKDWTILVDKECSS